MKQIPLIHPIYLDVPMMVSFVAAMQGGIAMESEVTEQQQTKKSSTATIGGRMGFSKLLQSLFDASLDASLESNRVNDTGVSRKESKAHTEASLAILLYHQLRDADNYIIDPQDISDVATYGPGTLVEVAGSIEKNAVDQMIDYIDAVTILSGLDASPPAHERRKGKHDHSAQSGNGALVRQLSQMRNSLDTDRKRTPISNIVVRCTTPKGLNVVATLRTSNLRDLTLSELDKNAVRVIGKITRTLAAGQTMSSFENYGMSLLPPATLNEAFSGLKNNKEVVTRLSDIEVAGPAWQILPLMIFV